MKKEFEIDIKPIILHEISTVAPKYEPKKKPLKAETTKTKVGVKVVEEEKKMQ